MYVLTYVYIYLEKLYAHKYICTYVLYICIVHIQKTFELSDLVQANIKCF